MHIRIDGRVGVDMILADKISMLRKQNGWSQEELAAQLGISRQSVSKWESGNAIPDLDKIIKMSNIFGVSTDYLLKDEMENLVVTEPVVDSGERENVRKVSVEEGNAYMDMARKSAAKIALGVMLCILSPVCVILLAGMQECGVIAMTEDMAAGLGSAVLLFLIAIAVAVFIFTGMQLSKYEYMEKEILSLEYGLYGVVEKKKEEFELTFRICIASGVAMIILGLVPMMIAAALSATDMAVIFCTALFLVLIACAVFLFVWSGMIHDSYSRLLQVGDYTEEKKLMNKKTSPFASVYWCVITAIYLFASFVTGRWDKTWIIWPVAGVLFGAVHVVLSVILKDR